MKYKELELITLGELAMMFKVNKSLLTYYNKINLIKPHGVAGKVFLYEKNDTIKKVKKILSLKDKGKSISKIKETI